MKHRILIRFRNVREEKIIEVFLDERLSFNDNFALLSRILDEDLSACVVYDPYRKTFLDSTVPLKEYSLSGFLLFHVFSGC